jgi:hypothetical protein
VRPDGTPPGIEGKQRPKGGTDAQLELVTTGDDPTGRKRRAARDGFGENTGVDDREMDGDTERAADAQLELVTRMSSHRFRGGSGAQWEPVSGVMFGRQRKEHAVRDENR